MAKSNNLTPFRPHRRAFVGAVRAEDPTISRQQARAIFSRMMKAHLAQERDAQRDARRAAKARRPAPVFMGIRARIAQMVAARAGA